MYYTVESNKTFDQAATDLEKTVKDNGFGVLHIHNLGATLRSKGINFTEECKVFEVCNPGQAFKVLTVDMRLNMALPCRISVYTDNGKVHIGYIEPIKMLGALSNEASLIEIAKEVENSMTKMVTEAR
jgi:uncharacterized protein (DUF302 family)